MTDRWQHANCHHPSVTPTDFSPTDSRGHPDKTKARRVAARLCGPCPARDVCLDYTLNLAANGLHPQGIVQAGLWWPTPASGHAAAPPPENLLDVVEDDTEGAAA